MTLYEYKILPAPTRGLKAKGVRSSEARFANAIETAVNAEAAAGWEFVRSDTLPHEERQGLTGSATTFRSLLVFRRPTEAAPPAETPPRVDPPLLPNPQSADPAENTAEEDSDDLVVTPQIYADTLRKPDDPEER